MASKWLIILYPLEMAKAIGVYPIFTPKRCAETLQVDSSDASSLMLGFRHVLRGLCDGDLLLDRSSCRIVDDASGLERLLKSNKTFGHRVRDG
jgi:hypothetical protein